MQWMPCTFVPRDRDPVPARRAERVVPERHGGDPDRELRLEILCLPARGAGNTPPVIYLHGGPGESAIGAAAGRLFGFLDRLRDAGDVIVLDQRGSGTAALVCTPWEIPPDPVPTRESILEIALERSRTDAARLRGAGVDLDAYNTRESAADVAMLVDALDVPRAHLVGHSYGSHLAMAVAKFHPDRVASVVLAGPEGPDQTWKLPSSITRQLEVITERANAPQSIQTIGDVLSALEQTPATVALPDGRKLRIGRFDVEYIAAAGAADTRMIELMPYWFERMARGDFSDFATNPLPGRYLSYLRGGMGTNAAWFCIDCASGASSARRERIAREAEACPLGNTIDFPFPDIEMAWNVADLGDAFRSPPRWNMPTLFVTGALDCRTPAANVAELSSELESWEHIEIAGAGHVDMLFAETAAERIVRFLNAKRQSS